MSSLELDDAERHLVSAYAHDAYPRWGRLGFYAALIGPAVVFAGYGAVRGDVFAMGIGFCGLLLLVLWYIVQEQRYQPVFTGLMRKIAAHERRGDG
jgi:hypothetical protein